MTWLLVAAGAVVALGAGVAVGARDARSATGGALVMLVIAPFLADPLPASPELAFRIVAGVLAGYLLGMASRGTSDDMASPLGLPAGLVAATAAFAAGLGATAVGLPSFGPTGALAAGLACVAVSVAPIARSRDPFRLGVALVVLLEGGLVLRSALVGTPPALETMVAGGALAFLAGAVAVLAGAALTAAVAGGAGHGGAGRAGGASPLDPTGTRFRLPVTADASAVPPRGRAVGDSIGAGPAGGSVPGRPEGAVPRRPAAAAAALPRRPGDPASTP